MYECKKTKGRIKRYFIIVLFIAVASVASIFMYINTNNYSVKGNEDNSSVVRLSQNLEQQSNTEQDIIELLEQTIKCVVGISKIKNTGNSIFLNNSTNDLGLGTGMTVTSNRIYSYKLACGGKQI